MREPRSFVRLVLVASLVMAAAGWAMRDATVSAQRAVPRTPITTPEGALNTDALRLTADRADAFVEAARRGVSYLPAQVIVNFRNGTSPAGRQRALTALRSRPSANELRWMGDVALLRDDSQPDATLLATQLRTQPEVEYAHPNFIRRMPASRAKEARAITLAPEATPIQTPADPDYSVLQWNFTLLNMPAAWGINPGGRSDLIVAVIDTGLTAANFSFNAPIWTGQSFQSKSFAFAPSPDIGTSRIVNPFDFALFTSGSPVLDFDGHGTHTASTIAEDANTKGLIGMAYNVKIMPLKVCVAYWEIMLIRASVNTPGFIPSSAGGCDDASVIDAMHYAVDNGARVINLSLGGTDPSTGERDAITYAVSKGAFVSISTGNRFEQGNPTDYPAAYAKDIDGAVAVAAVGPSSKRAYYSTTGSYVEVAAPGGDDRVGGGEHAGFVWQVTLFPNDQDPNLVSTPRFDRYAEVGYEGTSMAAPHVAGLAALLMSQGTLRDPRAIESFIKATAKDIGPTGRDDETGDGLIQARTALFGLGISR